MSYREDPADVARRAMWSKIHLYWETQRPRRTICRVPDYRLDPPEWFNTDYDDEDDDCEPEDDPAWDYADEDRAASWVEE